MKISGLTLFKLLPGGKKEAESNCKKCGYPTCMAYAMKLAKGEASITDCEFASDELKQLLESEGGKSQIELSAGPQSQPLKIGGENVLYRHDKTFVNPTMLTVKVKTSEETESAFEKIDKIFSYEVERVGQAISLDSIAIDNNVQDAEQFNKLVQYCIEKKVMEKQTLLLVSENKEELIETSKLLNKVQKPVLYLKNASKEELIDLQKETSALIIVEGENIQTLIALAEELENAGITDLILTLPSIEKDRIIETLTQIRRSVILNNCKPLRFPVITYASDYCSTGSETEEGLWAGNLICKYANIVVLDQFDPAVILALITLRQNLYTDPQKPLQIEPKLYTIGDVDEYSPVIVTTNFALTYFSVAGEVEASGIPAYILITASEGMSVLTAWAANKFSGEIIAKAVKENALDKKIKDKKLIISGYVEVLKEEIEEELPEWEVVIAPKEAVEIPEFLNKIVKAGV
jgi:acetyl-CoA decarbonylase/synthase complex subunit gamma